MIDLAPFSLTDLNSENHQFPKKKSTLLCFVKEDCPTCNLISPLIELAHVHGESDVLMIGQTVYGNELLAKNHELTIPVLDDSTLKVSFAYELESVPHLFFASETGEPIDELIGFDRAEWR